MKRHISDLTKESNEAKGSIPSDIDKTCEPTEQSPAQTIEVSNEYRNDDLDITFVDNQFIDLGSDKIQEHDSPFDIKNADITRPFDTTIPCTNEVIPGYNNDSQAVPTSSKLPHDNEATYITPQLQYSIAPFAGPLPEFSHSALDSTLARLSKYHPNPQVEYSNLTNFAEDKFNAQQILGKPLVNFPELHSKPAASTTTGNFGNNNQTAVHHPILKNSTPTTTTTSKARGRPKLRPTGYIVCRFPGCKVVGFKLKNGACDLHQKEVKLSNAKQRTMNNHFKKGNDFPGYPFKHHRNPFALQIIEYYKSTIIPGIRVAGEFETITDSSSNLYASLKKNGFALYKNAINIKPKDVFGLKSFYDENKSSFNKLFTTFRRSGKVPVFLNDNEPGRHVCIESSVLHATSLTCDIEVCLKQLLEDGGFPRNQRPFDLQWSILKSDPHLQQCQHAHCDSETENQYYKASQFRFSCFIGIEEYSFLDIRKPTLNAHQRVIIQSGSVLFFRNDVAHRGTENNTDFNHYRIHCFIDAAMFSEKRARYSVVDAVPFV